jgi:hypothetical protein
MTLSSFPSSGILKDFALERASNIATYTVQLYISSKLDVEPSQETFHQRVVELGELAAHIALDAKKETLPRLEQAQLRLKSLNEWHRSLPAPMQLSRLNLADSQTITWYTKRSLLQLHMLFLGLFNEPYRSCLVELGKSRLKDTRRTSDDVEIMINIENQCVSAARHCARVMSLLQVDNLIRSHCWVALYVNDMAENILQMLT